MQNRREFIKGSSVFAAMMAAAPTIVVGQGAARVFKVGLVGCGGRGKGAVANITEAAKQIGHEVKIVAVADFFLDKAQAFAKSVGCDEKMAFGGASGYKKLLESDCEIVMLATPPAFRPVHAAAVIQAGKHLFAEKPVAVDGPGIRSFLETAKAAAAKKLSLVAGTQRRHMGVYMKKAKALKEGKLSPIIGGTIYWNGTVPWTHQRRPEDTNASYMAYNWLNWTEMSGDHIVEQHVHNLDVANWFLGRTPKNATGFGGRARRKTGNQFDFFSIDFDYGDGVHIHSMCRQLSGCSGYVGERFRNAEAEIVGDAGKVTCLDGKEIQFDDVGHEGNGQVNEHVDMLKGILSGELLNEGENVAMSTACAIIGRMSAYTGQTIRMSDILTNDKSEYFNMACKPAAIDFESGSDVALPPEDVVAVPGKDK